MQEQIFGDVISHKFPADKVTLFLEYAFKTMRVCCKATGVFSLPFQIRNYAIPFFVL